MEQQQLVRLKVWLQGTRRSKRLKDQEDAVITIPCWIPNPERELFEVNDFLTNVVFDAPENTGDLVTGLIIETAFVSELNYRGSGEELDWKFAENIYEMSIKDLAQSPEAPFETDISSVALWIQQNYPHWFGWGNADASDVIDLIEISLR